MKKYLINLDRSVDRLRRFYALHSSIDDIVRFKAVDGLDLSRNELINNGVMLSDVPYSMTELGCYLSHTALWQLCIDIGEPITVVEDDAILSAHFDLESSQMISSLSQKWDFIMWGWNFDAYLTVDLIPGVSPARIACFENLMRKGVGAFRLGKYKRQMVKLMHGMGLLCYSISPEGARELLSFCKPLRWIIIDFQGFGVRLGNHSIDRMMNAKYRSMNCYVSLPPLAISENDKSNSTIVESFTTRRQE